MASAETISLETLTPDDLAAYNRFFSEGAKRFPVQLRISPDDIKQSPFGLPAPEDGCTIVAVRRGRWLGVGSLERERGRVKRQHIAWIVRMLVLEPNQGVGRVILQELKRRGALLSGVAKLNLTVAEQNAAAVHLYRSEGFLDFSREEDAFRYGDQSVTELSLSLKVGSATR